MKTILILLFVNLLPSGFNITNNSVEKTQINMDKIIVQTALLNCSPEKAFEMFTSNNYLEKWLTVIADVELSPGGKYELFWEPNDRENNSTLDCKILAIDKPNFLNFEWRGPTQFKHFMNNTRPLTNVTVTFVQKGFQTQVTLIHTGWRDTEGWEQARIYFVNAWKGAFSKLEKFVN